MITPCITIKFLEKIFRKTDYNTFLGKLRMLVFSKCFRGAESSFTPVNCCSHLGVKKRCVSLARSFGSEKKSPWRGAENAGVEAEISLSALRYPSFPDVAKQNRGHTRRGLLESRSHLLFHRVGVRGRPLTGPLLLFHPPR